VNLAGRWPRDVLHKAVTVEINFVSAGLLSAWIGFWILIVAVLLERDTISIGVGLDFGPQADATTGQSEQGKNL